MQPATNERWTSARLTNAAPAALAAAFILTAFALALRATAGLEWPCEIDFYRDLGAAQTWLDGAPGTDPAYLGEAGWYNPLQPAVFAALSSLTGVPLHILYARAGPYLNLLGPLGFYLMARQLLSRWAALAALGAYLFLGHPAMPSWHQATYSPWAWPLNVTQGLFCLTVVTYIRAVQTRRWAWDLATGLLLGVTFLSHTAPAMVFVGTILLMTAGSLRADRARHARRLVVVGALSLLVSLPYLAPVILRYRLRVQNILVGEYVGFNSGYVLRSLVGFRPLWAAVGLVTLVKGWVPTTEQRDDSAHNRSQRRALLAALCASAVLLFGYGMMAQVLFTKGVVRLPRIVPTYHFFLYAKMTESLLFGLGLTAVAQFIIDRIRPRSLVPVHVVGALTTALLLLAVVVHFPGYLGGKDLTQFRQDALTHAAETDRIALYRWLLADTRPDDVFLADPVLGVWAIAAADRKVVCIHDQYSNLYVSYEERMADLRQLFESLRTEAVATFDRLAKKYRLTHVVLASDSGHDWCRVPSDRLPAERFELVFVQGVYRVYRFK